MKTDLKWILSKDGKIYGPFSFEQLDSLYKGKKIAWTDLVVEAANEPRAVEWLRVGQALVSSADPVQAEVVEPHQAVVLDTGDGTEITGPEDLGFRRTLSGSAAFTAAGDGSGVFAGKGECRDIGTRGMTISSGQIPGQRGSRISLKITPAPETTIPPFLTDATVHWISHEGREFTVEFSPLDEKVRNAIQLYVTGKVKVRKN